MVWFLLLAFSTLSFIILLKISKKYGIGTIIVFAAVLIMTNILIFFPLQQGGIDGILTMLKLEKSNEVVKAKMKDTSNLPIIVELKDKVQIDAPVIKQFPELPRGCEVTSLAMLLQFNGIETDKMELAERIKKNKTPLEIKSAKTYWGHPNEGFVGDMYSYNNPGLGVYHQPIRELAEKYLPGEIVDLTGESFEVLKTYLSLEIPIWVITNTTYNELPLNAFEKWYTPQGEVMITYKEHSVLVTGYDNEFIYFNDPISGIKNKAVPVNDFIDAWIQMGQQAITVKPGIK